MNLQQLEQDIDKLSIEDLEELYFSLGDYEEVPVDIETFCTDPEFLGGKFEYGFNPYWLKVLKEIYPSPVCADKYSIIVLRGCIGRGKTYTACIGILYDIYRLLCLKNPQRHVGLANRDSIMNMFFNITLDKAKDTGWTILFSMMRSSPYFREQLDNAPHYKNATMFPKDVHCKTVSRLHMTLGKAVLNVLMDEVNFGIVKDQVYDSFNSLLTRMTSRFLPGKIWIVSSEQTKSSAMTELLEQHKGDTTYVDGDRLDNSALWHVFPENFSKETFKVFVGTETIAPRIIDTNDSELLKNYQDYVINVPEKVKNASGQWMSVRKRFESDIYQALQDLAGVSTVSTYKLFKLKDRLNNAFTLGAVFPDTIQLDFDDERDLIHGHILYPNYFETNPYGKKPRTIHIDIGISGDRLGIAATVLAGFEKKMLVDPKTFEYIEELVPITKTEWAVGIEHKPGQQVPLYKVRAFLFWLTKKHYPIALISLDGYQSTDFMQIMKKNGYTTELVSVDREATAYMSLRQSIYRGTHQLPQNGVLKTEMNHLEVIEGGKKIDHPVTMDGKKGSKDIADAVAGSHYTMNRDAHNYKLIVEEWAVPTMTDRLKETLWGVRSGN